MDVHQKAMVLFVLHRSKSKTNASIMFGIDVNTTKTWFTCEMLVKKHSLYVCSIDASQTKQSFYCELHKCKSKSMNLNVFSVNAKSKSIGLTMCSLDVIKKRA